MTSQPEVSVVVCTYGRATKLASCLEALARQTFRARAEVIVVDDGSTDSTAEVVSQFDVRLEQHDVNRGLAAARNTGIRAAVAPVVAFTDDDCVPAEGWLEALLEQYYADDDVVGVGGGVAALQLDTIVRRYLAETNRLAPLEMDLSVSTSMAYRAYLYLQRNLRIALVPPHTRAVYSLVGANMSFRRGALLEVGLFDPRIRFGGEDEDICRRLREAFPDRTFVYTPFAPVAHDFEGDLRDALRRSYRYGKGSARGFLKNHDQGPTLFPVPALVFALIALGLWRPWTLAAATMLPFVVFSKWPVEGWRSRRAELLAFPALQLLEEAAHDLGFARDWLRLRREYASSHRVGIVG
jgi:glycosyltransferase involved in cell wall biosynthesis